MSVIKLIWLEIVHRKLGFFVALVTITITVAACVCALTLIRSQQLETEKQVAELDDEIRKITKSMGFNVMVFPRDQNLADFHATDFAEKTMPEAYVHKLAESTEVVTVQHLRPALIRKVDWPERNRQVILMGVSAVIPFLHRSPKTPLADPVPAGTMELGNLLAEQLGLKTGDQIEFRGRAFEVGSIHPQQGNKDDITVWIDLATAQEMLELPGQVNMIQALECNCATIDRLAEIDKEISGLLGDDVQVIEMANIAIARAKSRNEVQAAGKASVKRIERIATFALPAAIAAAGLIVGLLALANVRERRAEIGVLRALGVRSRQLLTLFVGKAVLLGVVGAVFGFGLGYGLGRWSAVRGLGPDDVARVTAPELFQPALLAMVMIFTPLLATLASWLPAVSAAAQDPAVVLREE
ncbi:MAG: FtsX-like permease family protein [Planctomycetales bacterium]|nr:FtsX-like permease family protein [Planctomycetales bacterium]